MSQHHCLAWHLLQNFTAMEAWRAEQQLKLPKVEWEMKNWLVDHLKRMKPWDHPVFLLWGYLLPPMSLVPVVPTVFGRTGCGNLTVNWAGLCLFPASPEHINKRLVPNCGIKWDGVFHHQRALELHLRLLFVSVETTRTTGRAWS